MTSVLPIALAVVGSFVNPIADVESADPCVVCDALRGCYYFLRSSGKSVDLYRARQLSGVRRGEKRIAWAVDGTSEVRGDVWAPELHRHSSGRWYVYASGRLSNGKVALFALESRTGDPFDGFAFKSVLDAETWCAFHGTRHENSKHEALLRVLHVQRVGFTASGVPLIGPCLGRTARLMPPSGEDEFLKRDRKESK